VNNLYSIKLVLLISIDPIMFRGLSAFEFYQSLFRVRTYGFYHTSKRTFLNSANAPGISRDQRSHKSTTK